MEALPPPPTNTRTDPISRCPRIQFCRAPRWAPPLTSGRGGIFAETPYIYRDRRKLPPPPPSPAVNQKAINGFYGALYALSTRRDLFVSLFSEFASLARGASEREFLEMPELQNSSFANELFF